MFCLCTSLCVVKCHSPPPASGYLKVQYCVPRVKFHLKETIWKLFRFQLVYNVFWTIYHSKPYILPFETSYETSWDYHLHVSDQLAPFITIQKTLKTIQIIQVKCVLDKWSKWNLTLGYCSSFFTFVVTFERLTWIVHLSE